jgi:hypothetical protein
MRNAQERARSQPDGRVQGTAIAAEQLSRPARGRRLCGSFTSAKVAAAEQSNAAELKAANYV